MSTIARIRKSRSSSRPRSKSKNNTANDQVTSSNEDPTLSCFICNLNFKDLAEFDTHKTSNVHLVNFLKYYLEKEKSVLVENKNGVSISCLEYRCCIPALVIPVKPNTSCSVTMSIENNVEIVHFDRYEFLSKMPCVCEVFDTEDVYSGSITVRMPIASKYQVKLTFQPKDVGMYISPLAFMFHKENGEVFYIVRYIELHCRDATVDALQPQVFYDPSDPISILPPASKIIEGVKPPKSSASNPTQTQEIELKKVQIPMALQAAIKEIQSSYKKRVPASVVNKKNPLVKNLLDFLKKGLCLEDYSQYFRFLLNFEELQMDYDIRKYDMGSVKMAPAKVSGLLSLEVPGLAEKRPSVVRGDHIFVRSLDDKLLGRDIEYKGYVHQIEDTKVLLGLSQNLTSKFVKGLLFDVRFTYNHTPLYSMHRSLDMLTEEQKKYLLFPTWDDAATCETIFNPTERLIMYNRNIEANPEQLTAVKHIVAGSSLPAPYLVHGPPGTGKTVTIVEAIKQVWKLQTKYGKKSYILVSTPSNSACDLITERLLEHINASQILRMYAYSRDWKQVPQKIKESNCTNYDRVEECFYTPVREKIMSFRIVISTLTNSTRIVSSAIPDDHFTHVFIDEAGHGLEAETLIPVAGILKSREPGSKGFGGQLVLAGDPLQLGPVIRCKVAEKFNLGRSFLERLMTTCDVYQRQDGKFDPRVLTRLVRNYRSHPAIVNLPSRLFYDSDLEVFADKLERESLCHWEGLTNQEFPILFHGVYGRDLREEKSPSYFNAEEVSIVITYVKKLLEARNRGIKIDQKHIGIITPYRQQVTKIRNQLCSRGYNNVPVGSVDEFQGQERRVIIISTVRSNPDLMQYDAQFKLGFVKNPKRFNVSITRAKSLLIIVGNPKLLALDKHWKELLMYCWREGSYVGSLYEPPENEILDVIERMKSMCLIPTLSPAEQNVDISQRAQQEDPQWRHDF